jgi:hypothetical protein
MGHDSTHTHLVVEGPLKRSQDAAEAQCRLSGAVGQRPEGSHQRHITRGQRHANRWHLLIARCTSNLRPNPCQQPPHALCGAICRQCGQQGGGEQAVAALASIGGLFRPRGKAHDDGHGAGTACGHMGVRTKRRACDAGQVGDTNGACPKKNSWSIGARTWHCR